MLIYISPAHHFTGDASDFPNLLCEQNTKATVVNQHNARSFKLKWHIPLLTTFSACTDNVADRHAVADV
jgi:hypothetical protein